MKTEALLADLTDRGIALQTRDGQVRFQAPRGVVTPEIRELLQTHKAALLGLLPEGRSYTCASFSQRRLWFVQQLDPAGVAYNMEAGVFRLDGPLSAALLEEAINAIVARHEALRTAIQGFDGRPVQVVMPSARIALEQVDVTALPEGERWQAAMGAIQEKVHAPFDLAEAPLLRAVLARLDPVTHIFALPMHHIISDGWSIGLILREVAAWYGAARQGASMPLAPVPLQYADYARQQRLSMQGPRAERGLAYWRTKLEGEPETLAFPFSHNRPRLATNRGGQQAFQIPRGVCERLREVAREAGSTLYMALLAAFETLLMRHGGQEDFLIGAPVANRDLPGAEGAVGFFINTVLMRAEMRDNPPFDAFLQQVRQTTLEAFEYQDYPFEQLVEALCPERDLSRNPLFQVMFVLDNMPRTLPDMGDVLVTRIKMDAGITKADLNLHIEEADGAFEGYLQYNRDLFEPDMMACFLDRFEILLEGIAANPKARLQELPVLLPGERRITARPVTLPHASAFAPWPDGWINQTIPEAFAAQVNADPDALAVVTRDGSWTYGALNAAANQIARALIKQGKGRTGHTGVLFGGKAESPDDAFVTLAAMLGVLKAGLAYVPLDRAYPAERLAFVAEDAGLDAIVGRFTDQDEALWAGYHRIDVNTCLESDCVFDPAPQGTPDDPAYVLYTSGSTGRPKGVVQTQRNVLYYIRAYTHDLAISPKDRLTLLSSFGFDAAVMDIFSALLNGATLYPIALLNEHPLDAAQWIADQGITIYHSTPSAYRALFGSVPNGMTLPAVRAVVLGGETCRAADLKTAAAHFSHDGIFMNLFGSSEASYYLRHIERIGAEASGENILLGAPIEGAEVALVDRSGAAGQPFGEIVLHCEHIAQAYWGQTGASASVFLSTPEGRAYRSGDLAWLQPGGTLGFAGRRDAQVKVRGHRVELGEIETVLMQHPGVREAAVTAIDEGDVTGMRLTAYVSGAAHDAAALLDWLRVQLPEYMTPNAVIFLDALPRTPNGKVHRKALPPPCAMCRTITKTAVEPETPSAIVIAGIWEELLHVDRVGLDDHFFALGGHSLLATQVVSRIQAALGVTLPLRTLFEAPTVRGLAMRVDAMRTGDGENAWTPIPRIARDERLPLSFGQQRLWMVDQLAPGSPAYIVFHGAHLTGPVDADAMERALNQVVARHETLRTVFPEIEGRPVQQILEATWIVITRIDLREQSVDTHEDALNRCVETMSRTPFDLARGPLIRAALVRESEAAWTLLLAVHHIAADGWSMGVLGRELSHAYAGGLSEPPLPVQYADYAAWQRDWLTGALLDRQLAYWRKQLENLPSVALPTDRPRPRVQSFQGAVERMTLSKPQRDAVMALSRRMGATPFMVLLTGFLAVLRRCAGQDDLVIGTPVAGRTRREIEPLIGFFVNMLALRARLVGSITFEEAVALIRETTLGAYDHQDIPFERIVDELHPERDLSRNPLFQISFVLQNLPDAPFSLPDIDVKRMNWEPATTRFDLEARLWDHGDSIESVFFYATDLFNATTVRRWIAMFQQTLERAVSAPEMPLNKLVATLEEDKAAVLAWGQSRATFPVNETLHARFAACAAQMPDRIAVTHDGVSLTYAELDARANCLARRLCEAGVQPGALTGLCVERSADAVTGILGILKTGAAYLPLDLAYPDDRLRFMIEDAGANVIVMQQGLQDRIPGCSARRVYIDDVNAADDPGAHDIIYKGDPQDRAYVIYTSGSTGKPKGVQVTHGNVLRLFASTDAWFGFNAQDVWTLFHSYGFDFSVWEIWGALLYGGKLVIVPYLTSRNPEAFLALLMREQVTVLNQTPSAFRQLMAAEMQGSQPAKLALRYVVFGGEALDLPSLRPWFDRHGDASPRLINMYGITETTVHVTYRALTQADADAGTGSLIGKPLPDLRLYLLDALGEIAPLGAPGEMYVGGGGVSMGYLNRPELNETRFLPDPFATDSSARLYRSGDLARYHENGDLEYLGRIDAQVQVRGFRVELGEIEAVIGQYDGIQQAAVIAREETPGDLRLTAYVAAANSVSLPGLRAHIQQHLPGYMMPNAFVFLATMPLTENGKINRAALPSAAPHGPVCDDAYVAPRDDYESQVAGLFCSVLNIPRAGAFDNFFDAGGHSLLATQFISRARDAFGVQLALRDFFEDATVAGVAARIHASTRATAFAPIEPREARILQSENEDSIEAQLAAMEDDFHDVAHGQGAGAL